MFLPGSDGYNVIVYSAYGVVKKEIYIFFRKIVLKLFQNYIY